VSFSAHSTTWLTTHVQITTSKCTLFIIDIHIYPQWSFTYKFVLVIHSILNKDRIVENEVYVMSFIWCYLKWRSYHATYKFKLLFHAKTSVLCCDDFNIPMNSWLNPISSSEILNRNDQSDFLIGMNMYYKIILSLSIKL